MQGVLAAEAAVLLELDPVRIVLFVFEGVVISRKGQGVSETFTVRSTKYGVGVEKTFPVHSPNIAYINVVKKGVVRRAKLYFLRTRKGQYKIKEAR